MVLTSEVRLHKRRLTRHRLARGPRRIALSRSRLPQHCTGYEPVGTVAGLLRDPSAASCHMLEAFRGHASTARGANNQFGSQQERFDLIDQRVGRNIHGVRDGFDSGWPTAKDADQRFDVTPILRSSPASSMPSMAKAARAVSSVILPLALLSA